jgi:crotonobetainyl-CoA:carnitine CoA-transferase CaiB-like acyl-CoA transferase
MFGVIAILAAIEQRHSSGRGQQVTSALFETTAFIVGQHMAQQGVSGEEPPPMSVRRSAWAVYDIFECSNNEQVFIGIVSDSLWKAFCAEFSLDQMAANPLLAKNNDRVEHHEEIYNVIVPMFKNMAQSEAVNRLEKAGIPFAPINKPSDLFEDAHLTAGGGLVDVTLVHGDKAGESIKLPAIPLEMDRKKFTVRRDLPTEGGDSSHVLREAGFSEQEIESLLAAGEVSGQ